MGGAHERACVGEVLSLRRRPVIVEQNREYKEIGVRAFGRGIFHKDPVSGAALGSKRVFWIEPGDLVISNVFAWEGAVAVASGAESEMIGSHRFMTFVPADRRIDILWAAWFFQSERGLELIRRASPGSAGRNRTLAISRFEALEIPLPPIHEQRRAAHRLDLCSKRMQIISQRSATMRAAIAPILNGWLDIAIDRFDDRRELADVAVVTRGRSPRYEAETGLFAINQACIRWGILDVTRAREVEREWWTAMPETGRVRAGDVLVNSTGEGTIGRAALATDTVHGIPFDSHVLVVRCDKNILLPEFLTVYLRSRDGQSQVNQAKGANTTKQTELGKVKLERFMVPVPHLEDQALLVSRFREIQGRMQLIENRMDGQAERLSAVIPAMLNEAFAELV